MEQLKNELSETAADAKEYLDLQIALYKLKGSKLISQILVKIIKIFIFTNISLIILIFASFALASFADSYFNIPGIGFGIIALFFVVVALILKVAQRRIFEEPVIKMVVNYIFGNGNDTKQ
jgi:uncharacterized membrane protein YbhN (UPF0104 family)